jgi:hypothetical protein
MDALTPSTRGTGRPIAQCALPRRAGRSVGAHRPRHLPVRGGVGRRLGSDRGRHRATRCNDVSDLRARVSRPDRRDPRRAGGRDPPGDRGHRRARVRSRGIDSTGPPSRSDARRSRSRDRIRRSGSTLVSGRSPTPSGCAVNLDTNWRATRCESGCAEAENRPS